MMRQKSEIKGVGLELDQKYFGAGYISQIPKEVIGDKDRFQQITFNLISNAINNTYEGGMILIGLYYNIKTSQI